ncbi:hypothetical protein FHW83_004110 [Duganella sp. SG902]|uniref:DUF4124 domain-containing protein n=1 Tax=Duganella sp. SG902 TaxID=2587016 RepID=UPI00159DBF47|nr:DUF4124 domain-containing protein [Duganella sp. SG902]NVM78282.1 hypothetical protein [Duganella sp. SG902]
MKLILCAALAVMSGAAGAAVNKCVDQEGRVLYTDADCPQAATQQEETAEARIAPPVLPPVLTPAPRSRWADLPRPLVRKANVDTATLKAAYQSMLLEDELHKSRRLLSYR